MPTGEKQRPAEAASPAREDAGSEVTTLLAAAVEGIGGTERSGQVAMAQAVERSIATGEHLAVQADTGTGKSLAYLVPAAASAVGRQVQRLHEWAADTETGDRDDRAAAPVDRP